MSSIIFQKYDKIFSTVCSIKIDPVNYSICSISTITTEKCRNTVTLWCGGWQKLIAWTGNAAEPIADSFTDFLQNFTLSISSKSQQNQAKSQFSHPKPLIVPHIVKH